MSTSTEHAQVIPMPSRRNRQQCPSCGRDVQIDSGRFCVHSATGQVGDTCHMSRERTPVTGLSDHDHERRADLIAHLAWRVKDEDPQEVWDYLTVLPADELQRLLMLALAAVPVDRSIDDLYSWVHDLPAVRAMEAAGQ